VGEIAARRGDDLQLDADEIREYLSAFRYRIGPLEALGEHTFESLIGEEDA
jgi:hypothetical protein